MATGRAFIDSSTTGDNQIVAAQAGVRPLRVSGIDNIRMPANMSDLVGAVSLYDLIYTRLKALPIFSTAQDI